jgi:hypothetical protein
VARLQADNTALAARTKLDDDMITLSVHDREPALT